MDQLKSPGDFPGPGMKGNDRVRPLIITGTQSAVIIRAGASRRNEDQIALLVDGHDRPGVRSARVPGFCRISIWRDRIPTPPQRAGACVEGAHDAAGHNGTRVVIDRGADDDEVVDHSRRRGAVIPTRPESGSIAEAYLALFAKISAR